jgi:hypothetical protein
MTWEWFEAGRHLHFWLNRVRGADLIRPTALSLEAASRVISSSLSADDPMQSVSSCCLMLDARHGISDRSPSRQSTWPKDHERDLNPRVHFSRAVAIRGYGVTGNPFADYGENFEIGAISDGGCFG